MPFRPTLRQLEYVVAVQDLMHFRRAARHCHVSQPTLSVQILLVEHGLGTPLFERTWSHVSATPADVGRGERLMLALIDDMLDELSAQGAALGASRRSDQD